MKTILVSGASGIVGYGCLRSLQLTGQYKLIGTSIYDSLVAKKFSNVFLTAPHTNDENYIEWLEKIIREYQIDLLIPGIEIDMYKWNDYRGELESTGVTLLLNDRELINLCGDKYSFFEKLSCIKQDICIQSVMKSNYEKLARELGTPFLLKPRKGYASKGIVTINSENEYCFHKNKYKDSVMAQKLIHGVEFTVGSFYDFESRLCAFICLKRKLGKEGFTVEAESEALEGIEDILISLGHAFKIKGIANFQFIKTGSELKLLEINPRISSSTFMRTLLGYNECRMGVEFYLENKIPSQPYIKKGKVVRYMEEIVTYDGDNFGYSWEL